MALIGHPIVGDKRYSYAYAKQCSLHLKAAASEDDWRADQADIEGNSASVALSR